MSPIYNTALSASTVSLPRCRRRGHHWCTSIAPDRGSIDSDTVSGNIEILIHSYDDVDADGSLAVQWRLNGGAWMDTTYEPGGEHYEATLDTTQLADGSHSIEVRSIDSHSAAAWEGISVTVNNTSPYAAIVASDGAVAHWRLGEASGTTAGDAVGSNDAAYVGSPTLGVTSLLSAETDTAVDFDGVDDYVNISNSTDINVGGPWSGRTIELWFDADDITTRQVLFEEGGISRGLSIYLDDGTLYATAWNTPNDDATSPWGPVTVSTTNFSADIWWHVVVVMDEANDQLAIYVDGASQDTATGVGNLFQHVAKMGLGAMSDDVVFFDGSVTNPALRTSSTVRSMRCRSTTQHSPRAMCWLTSKPASAVRRWRSASENRKTSSGEAGPSGPASCILGHL